LLAVHCGALPNATTAELRKLEFEIVSLFFNLQKSVEFRYLYSHLKKDFG